ncbi:MAG: glutamate synthase subunit beta [Candidatus Sumerlaeia bacterium]|nr:glutamate synthase subunit beta [Candidatus Sumerlaeia bacterium]
MGKPTGFLEYRREEVGHRPVDERVRDHLEIDVPLSPEALMRQAARCMDCGIPFCHGAGCPLHNRIPEFNDLLYRGRWREAADLLHANNNFPEITGRVCPALCEPACVLAIHQEPVLIKHIECQIVERAWREGWIVPQPAPRKSGFSVAIIGSGPAGLAAAQQLARAGHAVTVFEKDDRIGGLLRYGIPDFKLDKRILDRRLDQLRGEGVEFRTDVYVGVDISLRYLRRTFDAILLAMGAGRPRDLDVPGRQGAANIHFALEFLAQQNRLVAGDAIPADKLISAKDKIVIVIGGGDTGSDCIGAARRQGARQIHQLEILPKPPDTVPPSTPWPLWPQILRTSSSHEEGCERRWSVLTKGFTRAGDSVTELHGVEIEWSTGPQGMTFREIPGSEFSLKADLVLLAMGYVHVEHEGLIQKVGLQLDRRGNIVTDENFMTSEAGIFAAGDCQSGASLVVRAILQGRSAAEGMDRWLRQHAVQTSARRL